MGDGREMESIELLIMALSPTIVMLIFVAQVLQRLAKVETNVTILLQWVACLNGEMSDKKEFKDFLKQLKEVAKGKGL